MHTGKMPRLAGVAIFGGLLILVACSNPPTVTQTPALASPSASHILAVELREGEDLQQTVAVGEVVAVHLHKLGAIHSDWSGPSYFSGVAGDAGPRSRAPQVHYPLAAPPSPADRYFAFFAKTVGSAQIGFSYPVSCTGAELCLPRPEVLSLTITD